MRLAMSALSLSPERFSGCLARTGQGRTTLVKIALTIARPTNGEARLFGQSVRSRSILSRVGYLPENPRFPVHLTARQVLSL